MPARVRTSNVEGLSGGSDGHETGWKQDSKINVEFVAIAKAVELGAEVPCVLAHAVCTSVVRPKRLSGS